MSLLNALSVGQKGISAASVGIETTSQNVSNASTKGYTRRAVMLGTAGPVNVSGVWVGQGVDVLGIQRAKDRLLTRRLIDATGSRAQAESAKSTLQMVEGYFDLTRRQNLLDSYDSFYDSLGALTADPSDLARRRGLVDAAQALSSQVSSAATAFEQQNNWVVEHVKDAIDTVNRQLADIAMLNKAIDHVGGPETGPADLMDRRDRLASEVAETLGIHIDLRPDGLASILVGGHAAVTGAQSRSISYDISSDGSVQLFLETGKGRVDISSSVSGTIGGYRQASVKLNQYLSSLNDFAYNLGNTFNDLQAAGFDAAGAAGQDLFVVTASPSGAARALQVTDAIDSDPSLLALAADASAEAGDDGNLRDMMATETDALFDDTTKDGRTALTDVVSAIGGDISLYDQDAENFQTLESDLTSLESSISGVSLDEEAIKLIEYQAAYRAASRVMSVADELMQTLFSIGA